MKVKYRRAGAQLTGAMLLAWAAALPAFADYQSTVLSQGPVGYWRLNETTPPQTAVTTAANLGSLSATGNGTYTGPQGFFRGWAGALTSSDTAAKCDGSAQNVKVPFNASLATPTFTVEAWVNSDISGANCVLSCGAFANPRSGWLIYQNGTDGYNLRMYNQNGTATSVNLVSAGDAVIGNWVHLAATFDGTTARLYVNGVQKASATPTGFIPDVSGGFAIGMRADGAFFWGGKVDEVAYYGTALSANDIATRYGAATTNAAGYAALILANNPLLYFRLNEPGDPFAANLGTLGAAAIGAYSTATVPGGAGPRLSAYAGFDSANNSVGFNGGTVTLLPVNLNTNTVTMTGWVKASGSQAAGADLIFNRAGTTVGGLTIDAVYGGLGLGYNWGNDNNTFNWSPNQDSGLAPLPDNDWAYVALVVQPTHAAIFTCAANNFAAFNGVTNTLTHGVQKFEGTTLLGADAGFVPARNFNGAIDEVAIFNRALAVGELYTQYGAALGNVPVKIFADPQAPVSPLATGDILTLTVDAGGTPSLTYQWRKDSVAIPGATTSAFVKELTQADTGSYDCTVANGIGSPVTSAAAYISVGAATTPAVVTAPTPRTLYPNGSLIMKVEATGGGLKYQWSKGGTPIAGATKSNYTIPVVVTSDSGSYSVAITNTAGSISAGPVTVTVLAPANAYESAIVNDKPEAWYRLNDSGTALVDSMGRHDGWWTNIAGNPVTLGVPGAIVGSSDKAVSFDGSQSYGYVPFDAKLNAQTFAIEAWVKCDPSASDLVPVSSRSAAPAGYWLRTYPAGSWSGGVSDSGNSYYVPTSVAASAIVAGQWKHVVMLYDTSLRVYINGQYDGTGYVDFDRNPSAPLLIGALGGTTPGNFFKGQVDEVIVYTNGPTLARFQDHYSKAMFPNPIPPYFLTQPFSAEVVSNAAAQVTFTGAADGPVPITYQWYKNGAVVSGATATALALSCTPSNAGSYVLRATNPNGNTNSVAATLAVVPAGPAYVNVTNGLVLHLKFDGNLSDSSGRGNNGTAVGSPTIVPGRLGSGLFYSTSNSLGSVNYVTLGKPADLNLGTSTDFSVSYWIKQDAGQTNGDLPVLCSAINSYGNPGLTFAPSYLQGGWSYSLNGAVQVYGGVNTINDGNWHHLLHTFQRVGNALTYLDGRLVDTRPCGASGNLDLVNTLNIGQDPSGTYAEDGSATIDDLAVWRRALTQYEAYSIFYAATNSNASFDIPGTVKLNVAPSGTNIVITWKPGSSLGTLLQADSVNGPWTPVTTTLPTYTVPASAAARYYRLSMIE